MPRNPDNHALDRAIDDILMDVADNAMKAANHWRRRALEAERRLESLQRSLDYIPEPLHPEPGSFQPHSLPHPAGSSGPSC
jgi:hypothetical protein